MKILLCCDAGASTSMVAASMRKALTESEQHFVIEAKSSQLFSDLYKNYDVVLIGPHIRYKKAGMEKEAQKDNIPVEIIDSMDYAMQNGAKILAFAKQLREAADKK